MANEKTTKKLDAKEDIQNLLTNLVINHENMREKIKKDPKGVLEKEFGMHFPKDLQIGLIDFAEEDKVYFFLPDQLKKGSKDSLSMEEMGAIAGGGKQPTLAEIEVMGKVTTDDIKPNKDVDLATNYHVYNKLPGFLG